MKAEYKLKKERWKREMESQETPKSQRNQGEKKCVVGEAEKESVVGTGR